MRLPSRFMATTSGMVTFLLMAGAPPYEDPAGRMSWYWLAPTWIVSAGPAPDRSANIRQWPAAGLYEPQSSAVIARSGSRPSFAIDSPSRSRSTLERIAILRPRRRSSARAPGTSSKGGHDASDAGNGERAPLGSGDPS